MMALGCAAAALQAVAPERLERLLREARAVEQGAGALPDRPRLVAAE
jgi:hypothetical protein